MFYEDHHKNWKHVKFSIWPKWTCPHCNLSTLRIVENSLKSFEEGESNRAHGHSEYEPIWDTFVFNVMLICNDKDCNGIVSCHGQETLIENQEYDGGYEAYFSSQFEPKHFYPPIEYFKLEKTYPEEVKTHLLRSFSAYWSDSNSALNSLRCAVECILDDQGIKREKDGRPISFNNRIAEYINKNPELEAKDFLNALRKVGNLGSHAKEDKIYDYIILKSYDLIHVLLKIIYDKSHIKSKEFAKSLLK